MQGGSFLSPAFLLCPPAMGKSILITGGARSGKSRFAETQALAMTGQAVYIATAEAHDAEMAARIAEHQERRGAEWRTVAAPIAQVEALQATKGNAPRLVDCLTLWLSNLMHHARDVEAEARALLEAGARGLSTAVMLSPIRRSVSRSVSILEEGASAVSQAIVFAPEGTEREIFTETRLAGAGATSEDVARMVSSGGRILNDAVLIGDAGGTSGFLGRDGLKLADQGEIAAIPALRARAEGALLSHEASVGMIDGEKLAYLMASGMEEDAARDLSAELGIEVTVNWRTPVNEDAQQQAQFVEQLATS